MFVPEDNFKFLVLWKQIGPLCTGECEKLACIAEILMTLGVLSWPPRFFVYKRCSFDVTGSEKTLLVTRKCLIPMDKNKGVMGNAKLFLDKDTVLGLMCFYHGKYYLSPHKQSLKWFVHWAILLRIFYQCYLTIVKKLLWIKVEPHYVEARWLPLYTKVSFVRCDSERLDDTSGYITRSQAHY